MPEEKLDDTVPASTHSANYQSPQIEEVVTPDTLEREAAYAGLPAPSSAGQ